MRITRLVLTDVKRHAQLDIRPAAGLTIVRGPNEAGKSTVHEALEMVLFRKADANREDVRSIHRWGTEAHPEIVLEFEVDGRQGRLVKRFAGPRAEAELTLDGQTTRDFAFIQEEVAVITGIPNEAFFRATASVGHAELSAVASDEPAISDRLQKAISGADRGTGKAKKKLDAAIHRYRTEGQKNPGLLRSVREEIGLLETELTTGEEALARLEADRAQWAEAHARREALDTQLAREQADLAEASRAEALANQRDEAQERYLKLKRAAELVEEADGLRHELPTAVSLPVLRSAVGRATNLAFEISELEAALDVDVEVSLAAESAVVPAHPGRWLVIAVVFLVAAALFGFLVGGLPGGAGLVICVVISLGALAQAYRVASRRRQYLLAHDMAQDSATRRQELQRDQEDRLRRRRRELELLLEEMDVPEVATAEALLATMEQHTDRLAHIEGELRGLGVQERSVRRLEESRDESADDTERASHALAGMGDLGREPAAFRQAAGRLVEQTQPARDRARSEEDQAQGRVGANLVDAELVADVAERLAAARERQAELQRRVLIYEATRQAIEVAEQATLKTAARYLEDHMGPAVERITGGRYREVQVDDQSLAFRVRAPETGTLVDARQLSQGTSDQLYLAARLGLVRLVTMDRRPPIILDDPFVTFDEERAQRALELLKEVATEQGFQVLLLTCSDRFDALADELIVLDAPSSAPLPASAVRDPAPDEPSVPLPASAVPDPAPDEPSVADPAPDEPSAVPDPVPDEPSAVPDPAPALADPVTGVVDPFRLAGPPRG
ncbi:MAG TPA: AAA family ATPase [Candidatus Deferrimicrobium sp.]|nr:AAA family ATPase [Candidatus Deferrimicrobium sp.]